MYQVIEAFTKYKSSMEKIGKAIAAYSSRTLLDEYRFFEMSVFGFLTGNNDMHLKNFSFIKDGSDWTLAPAYDLLNVNLVLPTDTEEMALPIRAKKNRLNRYDFEHFGKDLGLNKKQIGGVFKRFINKKPEAFEWLDSSFLSDDFKKGYKDLMEERYNRIQ